MTSRSRNVNKIGGGDIDKINFKMTYLISAKLIVMKTIYLITILREYYANNVIDIHTDLIGIQLFK